MDVVTAIKCWIKYRKDHNPHIRFIAICNETVEKLAVTEVAVGFIAGMYIKVMLVTQYYYNASVTSREADGLQIGRASCRERV